MDSHTRSAFGRLEVVETGRPRRWAEDEKARIVLESLAGPRLVSATARRHRISRAQLLAWRRRFPEVLGGGGEEELVVGAAWSSQPEAVEAQDAVQMSKQHLDLFPLPP